MLTTTTKQLIDPISDAVSQLVAISANAEISHAPIPDLTEVAQIVASQVFQLVNIAKSLLNETTFLIETGGKTDITGLQGDMNAAGTDVSAAATLLTTATETLASDPYSAKGRTQLVESAKGILHGTQKILETYDESEIRKVLGISQHLREKIASINSSNPSSESLFRNVQELVEVIRQTHHLLVILTQLAKNRVPELLYPSLQTRLQACVDNLTKHAPLLISSCKMVIENPSNIFVTKTKDFECLAVTDICLAIEDIVNIRRLQETSASTESNGISSRIDKLGSWFAEIEQLIKSGDKPAIEASFKEYMDELDRILQDAKQIKSKINSAQWDEKVQPLIDSLTGLQTTFSMLAAEVAKDPTDLRKRAQLESVFRKIAERSKQLENALNATIAAEIAQIIPDLSSHETPDTTVGALYHSSIAGSEPQVDASLSKLENQSNRLGIAIGLATAQCDNPSLNRNLQSIQDEVVGILPQIVTASKAVTDCAKSASKQGLKEGQEYLSSVLNMLEDNMKKLEKELVLEQGVFKIQDLTAAALNAIDAIMSDTQKAVVANNNDSIKRGVNQLQHSLKSFISVIKHEIENTEDQAYKSKLSDALKRAETDLATATKKSFQAPTSKTLNIEQLKSMLLPSFEECDDVVRDTRGLPKRKLGTIKEEDEIKESEIENKMDDMTAEMEKLKMKGIEIVVVDAEAPELLSTEEAKSNPIKAAAQELAVEASRWSSDSNPIVQSAKEISSRLATLSAQLSLDTAQSKLLLLQSTKEIISISSSLLEHVKKIAAACTDKRLRTDLLTVSERVPTISQQLKILAAVKASGSGAKEFDKESEKQLITCVNNLMNAIKVTLSNCEAASIRCNLEVAGNVAVAAIKFKRNLFKKRAASGATAPAKTTQLTPTPASSNPKASTSLSSSGRSLASTLPKAPSNPPSVSTLASSFTTTSSTSASVVSPTKISPVNPHASYTGTNPAAPKKQIKNFNISDLLTAPAPKPNGDGSQDLSARRGTFGGPNGLGAGK